MSYNESDLRELLNEHGHGRAGREPSARLDAIVRRGRRIRRTRRAVTAGTALAFAAVAAAGLTGLLPAGAQRGEGAAVAQQPVDSARVTPGPELDDTMKVALGAKKFDLHLIHSQRFETVGGMQKVTFTPTSVYTGDKVVCDDPRAWVVIQYRGNGPEPIGSRGRCEGSIGGHNDELSVPSDWLKRPQSMQIWVFPGDAPVREVAEAVNGCRPRMKGKDCDEVAQSVALGNPEVRRRLSALVGEQPSRWAVGIYDRPAPSASAVPTGGPSVAPTATVVPTGGPTVAPTASAVPTGGPTVAPTATAVPTGGPAAEPTAAVTASPTAPTP
ncbi:hypothetical protein HTZ77_04900 [Nonomuraea sp. SMC257]|uniref:Uncharacterized protein n=1 Tax=Nonomuraea montanisoli TaxID=2741721 RepID=A0A7Y6I306_9ACTN|nr:hypothetical protein [Nonomuraea montanisoli]NUW30762.1 hypothetical protein [Nonomuraea montanisoli]